MPFQSDKQRRYLWANEPEIARDWTNRYGARGGGIMRVPLANGLRPDPFYNQEEFQTFRQPTRNWDLSQYPFRGPVQSGYTNTGEILGYPGEEGYKDNLTFEKDFRGNQLSDTGVQMMYKTPRTIADQNRVLGQTFTEKQPRWYNKMFNKAGQGIKKGWQGAKDFKTSIGEGIAGILDNTMIGKIAAMNNALNPRAANYNPALQGQIDFMKEQGMYGNNWDQSGLNKITGGVLQGKGLQSFFGSNDLGKMYDKSIAQTQKTINNIEFGKQWSTLKKDNPDEYYKKLAFHQNKLKQKEREKKAADIATRADLDKRKAASKANWQQDYSTWTSPSGRDHATTGGIGSPESKKGPAGGSIGASRFLARGGRASYFNGGLASLWPR